MLILASATDKLQLVTASAGNIQVHVSWMDNVSGAVGPGRTNTPAITVAGTTDIVAAPAAGVFRAIKTVHIRNTAITPNTVTLRHTDGTLPVDLYQFALPANATLSYIDEVGFFASQSAAIGTGDAKLTLKSTPDPGWIMMNDGTIGDGSSSASNRANSDCEALFRLLFAAPFTDVSAPLLTSAGAGVARASFADATAAWTAHTRVTLTRQLGRAISVSGTGAGLTARPLGSYDGVESIALTVAQLPPHVHPQTTHVNSTDAAAFPGPWTKGVGDSTGTSTGSADNTGGAGSGAGINIMNPRSYWNVMIKL